MTRRYMDNADYRFCPFCGKKLPLDEHDAEKASQHLLSCQEEKVAKQHPEVEDEPEPESCEHLTPKSRPYPEGETGFRRTHEIRGDEGVEDPDKL